MEHFNFYHHEQQAGEIIARSCVEELRRLPIDCAFIMVILMMQYETNLFVASYGMYLSNNQWCLLAEKTQSCGNSPRHGNMYYFTYWNPRLQLKDQSYASLFGYHYGYIIWYCIETLYISLTNYSYQSSGSITKKVQKCAGVFSKFRGALKLTLRTNKFNGHVYISQTLMCTLCHEL